MKSVTPEQNHTFKIGVIKLMDNTADDREGSYSTNTSTVYPTKSTMGSF
jgi:hypothetical protein